MACLAELAIEHTRCFESHRSIARRHTFPRLAVVSAAYLGDKSVRYSSMSAQKTIQSSTIRSEQKVKRRKKRIGFSYFSPSASNAQYSWRWRISHQCEPECTNFVLHPPAMHFPVPFPARKSRWSLNPAQQLPESHLNLACMTDETQAKLHAYKHMVRNAQDTQCHWPESS